MARTITTDEIMARIDYANERLAAMGKSSRYELHRRRGMDLPYAIEITINGESVDYPVMYGSRAECYDYMRGAIRMLDIITS